MRCVIVGDGREPLAILTLHVFWKPFFLSYKTLYPLCFSLGVIGRFATQQDSDEQNIPLNTPWWFPTDDEETGDGSWYDKMLPRLRELLLPTLSKVWCRAVINLNVVNLLLHGPFYWKIDIDFSHIKPFLWLYPFQPWGLVKRGGGASSIVQNGCFNSFAIIGSILDSQQS